MSGPYHLVLGSEDTRAGEPRWSVGLLARIRVHPDLIAGLIVGLGFVWRVERAQATFFNTDEAWHYALANQNSLAAAYKASLTISHPPLLVLLLYYWRHLGTSNLMLRLPSVIAGTLLCYAVYQWLSRVFGRRVGWLGLLFTALLPPMIALSAELRQYTLMMLLAVCSAWLVEEALARNSVGRMIGSCVCLYLAMLAHYSAFLFAGALGIYCVARLLRQCPRAAVVLTWAAGQIVGVGLAGFLYVTQISKLGHVYTGAQPLHNYADWYLSEWYFHPGRDRLMPFLYRGTLGIFRFTFGQTAVGQIAAVLFIAGVLLLVFKRPSSKRLSSRSTAVLLLLPFVLNGAAVVAGLYPFGRTRHCVYLALFAIAGVSAALSILSAERAAIACLLALGIIVACHAFGTLQGRDMIPVAEQRHEHMDQAIQFIRKEVSPEDVILTDKATGFQLKFYLCDKQPVDAVESANGYESFECSGLRVVSTGPDDGALTSDAVRSHSLSQDYGSARSLWVVQGGWARGLGEALRSRFPAFSNLQVHCFGRYLEVFQLPARAASTPQR